MEQRQSIQEAPRQSDTSTAPTVLVVDDMPAVVRAFKRILEGRGYNVVTAEDGNQAVNQVRAQTFDAVLSDIAMPGLTGVELLQQIRLHDQEVPVILVTGDPSVETAIPAVEFGALSYLIKPVSPDTLTKKVEWAVHLHRLSRMKRQALKLLEAADKAADDESSLSATFDSALDQLKIAYQPIVCWSKQQVAGYEALVRSDEKRLPHPGALFDAGDRLDRVIELNRRIRCLAPLPIESAPDVGLLFFNLHVLDLNDESLMEPTSPLARIADRVVLEVTERASLDDVPGVRSKITQLRELGFRIAVDDLGAGYAGLSSFALLEPDVVKLDMALVRDIHKEPTKQRLVRSMTQLCADMGLEVVAEGIECAEERDVLVHLGCDLLQGFFFGRPGAPFVDVSF